MNLDFLDFEQPIAELEGKIQALCNIKDQADIADEMQALKDKSDALTKRFSHRFPIGKSLNLLGTHKDFIR